MRTLLFCICAFAGITTFGQSTQKKDKIVRDTIVWLSGKKIGANGVSVTSTDVSYTLPGHPDSTIMVERKQLEKVIYKTGMIDVFSKPVVQMVDANQWEAVTITKDKSQVEGMYVRGLISAKSSPNARSKRKAQQNTYIKLQKKAAAVGATVVLITDEENYGGYGDVPGCYIEGTAYGNEPLQKGTDVVKDKDERPER